MTDNEIQDLLEKFTEGNCTPAEAARLKSWYNLAADKAITDISLDDLARRKKQTIESIVAGHIAEELKPKLSRLWPRIAVAAAAVVAITLGAWLYYTTRHPEGSAATRDLLVNDIQPGSVGATLTLANGKTIKLSSTTNGELAKEAGVTITKSADGQLIYDMSSAPSLREGTTKQSHTSNTLSTAKGETYQVKLPDGTAVWLNAASSLKYAANLLQYGKRKVTLQGEAYFQVAKDKAHPFIVESAGQQVEVLGTHFNVNAYHDERAITTTLLEGSVKVTSVLSSRGMAKDLGPTGPGTTNERGPSKLGMTSSGGAILKPGQQARNNGRSIQVAEVNVESITDWKDGDFFLNRVNFKTAMRKIARWYDVEVIYDSSVPDELESGGWISRKNNLSSVLRSIEGSGQVHFRLEGNKLYVTK